MEVAQELLPNLPRHALVAANTATRSGAQRSEGGEGHVAVNMESLMASEDGEPIQFSPQMAARMEEIRALLQNMNNRQQQQHQHSHSHLASASSPTPAPTEHTHSHSPDEAGDMGGGGAGGVDLRSVFKLLQTSGVFFILLLLRFMYDHRLGLIVMVAMAGTFHFVNMKLVQCIHHTAVREVGAGRLTSLSYPVWLLSFLVINITLVYYCFRDQALWNMLQYQMPIVAEVNIWALLWVVLVTDFVVKFATVAVKCCIFLLPAGCLPHRRRGKYYMFVEKVSQLYRLTLPVLPWFHYLIDDQAIGRWFAFITILIYVLFKTTSVFSATKEAIKAANRMRMQMSFGGKPGVEELLQRGTVCPICQDDYKEPILLSCKHIFCENCVSLWFDREKTCPMCRAQITDDPQWQDGSSSPSLQWY